MESKEYEVIRGFVDDYSFLSNDFIVPRFRFNDTWMSNATAAFLSLFCLNPIDRRKFAMATPEQSRNLFVMVERNPMMEMDSELQLSEMRNVVRAKFASYKSLSARLVSTHPALLINETTNDTHWGTVNMEGKNHLGKILMEIRDDLINQMGIDFDKNTAVRKTGIRRNTKYSNGFSEF